jgi:hypothetical protein
MTSYTKQVKTILASDSKQIDAEVVRGMLYELEKLYLAVKFKLEEVSEGPCITEADEMLFTAIDHIENK